MIVGGLVVGQGRIDNIVLRPGNNTVPIRATLDLKVALENLPAIIASQSSALKSGNIEISASGNSTIYHGQHIDYYEKVLNELVVTGQVPLIQILIDSATEFLGSGAGSLLTGFLGNLNLTSITQDIGGLLGGLGGGNSSSSGTSDLGNIVDGLLGGLSNSTSSGNSTDLSGLLNGLKDGLGGATKRSRGANLVSGMVGLARMKARLAKLSKDK